MNYYSNVIPHCKSIIPVLKKCHSALDAESRILYYYGAGFPLKFTPYWIRGGNDRRGSNQ